MLTKLATFVMRNKKNKGFTLIEVVAVMAIMGAMVLSLLPAVEIAMNRSKDTALVTNLSLIEGACKVYQMDTGKYPQDIQELKKGKYIPEKEYTDATGQPIKIDPKTGVASGTSSKGLTMFSSKYK